MSQPAPSRVPGNPPGHGSQTLTPPNIEKVVNDFRTWLQQTGRWAAMPPPPAEEQHLDLHTLLGQFLAVRHEVTLQTRAVRAQQEQNLEILKTLGQAVEGWMKTQSAEAQQKKEIASLGEVGKALEALEEAQDHARQAQEEAQDEQVRPFFKSIIDAHDALTLARREIQRVREGLEPFLEQVRRFAEVSSEPSAGPLPTSSPPSAGGVDVPVPFLAGLFGARTAMQQQADAHRQQLAALQEKYNAQQKELASLVEKLSSQQKQERAEQRQRAAQAADAVVKVRGMIDSVLSGYNMSLQRLDRILQDRGLEPIRCEGKPFDPEKMEVVEAVVEPGIPANEVLEVIRPGYMWNDKVFRCAQVRVAKAAVASEEDEVKGEE